MGVQPPLATTALVDVNRPARLLICLSDQLSQLAARMSYAQGRSSQLAEVAHLAAG